MSAPVDAVARSAGLIQYSIVLRKDKSLLPLHSSKGYSLFDPSKLSEFVKKPGVITSVTRFEEKIANETSLTSYAQKVNASLGINAPIPLAACAGMTGSLAVSNVNEQSGATKKEFAMIRRTLIFATLSMPSDAAALAAMVSAGAKERFLAVNNAVRHASVALQLARLPSA